MAKLLSRFYNATRKDNLGKLTAVREMLQHFEISPCGGTTISVTYMKSVISAVRWGNSGETLYKYFAREIVSCDKFA